MSVSFEDAGDPGIPDPPPLYVDPLDPRVLDHELSKLILANHILDYQNVLDAYGHVSARHPGDSNIFIMACDKAPALVSSPEDFIHYHISDASPVESDSKHGYKERFIHSEIYKRFPQVNSVVHSHSEAVLPYTMNGVAMKPVFHIAGFLGTHVPVYDIVPEYSALDIQDLLVSHQSFGRSLASHFASPVRDNKQQHHNVVLMANHGFTTVGSSIKQAVYRAVYTVANAKAQSTALMVRHSAMGSSKEKVGQLRYLNEDQVKGSYSMSKATLDRPWDLWVREVEVCQLYRRDPNFIVR